ncbi:MAG: amidohydrolase family protein [Nitrospirota bacterium]
MEIIDIHTHGIRGYDTTSTDDEDIVRIAEAHADSGVSEILAAIYPSTIRTMRKNMETVSRAMKKTPRIAGLYLEGPFLNPSKCGALEAASFAEPDVFTFQELIDGFEDRVRVITVAPEMKGSLTLIRKIADMGIIVSMGHSEASYAETEAGFNAGARGITHIFNAMRGFHHREPGIAGFGLLNPDVYIEVIADPYHLNIRTLELIFRVKRPDRVIIVSDTVKESKTSSKHSAVMDSYGALSGGCMTIVESSERLVRLGFDKNLVTKSISENPRNYLSST